MQETLSTHRTRSDSASSAEYFTFRFVSYATAAKGFALTAVLITSLLNLLAPTSLTARSSPGEIGDMISLGMLVVSVFGWADIIWTDIGKRLIWPSLNMRTRHRFCVGLYALISGMYWVYAFTAVDPEVPSSWVLIIDYVLLAIFSGVLAGAMALETRA